MDTEIVGEPVMPWEVGILLTAIDYLSLIYALAGLLGAALNLLASGRPLLGRETVSTYVTGFVMGGAWTVYPIIDFKPETTLIPRVIMVAAVAFFAADMVRNILLKRFGLLGGEDKGRVPMLLLPLLLLGGCATAGLDLDAFAREDIEAGLRIAQQNDDAPGAACAAALLAHLPEVAVARQAPVGAFSALMVARGVRRSMDSGIPEAIHTACAPWILDVEMTLAKLGLMAVPGGGLAGKLLGR